METVNMLPISPQSTHSTTPSSSPQSTAQSTPVAGVSRTAGSQTAVIAPGQESAGSDADLVVSYKSIRDIPGAPAAAIAAEEKMLEASKRRDSANPTVEQNVQYLQALINLMETSNRIYHASLSPKAPADPSLRSSGINFGVATLRNVVNFALPSALSILVSDAVREAGGSEAELFLVRSATFGASLAILSALMEPAGDCLRAEGKANVSSLLLACKGAATEGAYKKIAGQLGENIFTTIVYALVHSVVLDAVSSGLPMIGGVGKVMVVSVVSAIVAGIAMNLVKEATLAGATKLTLRRNDVTTARDLPIIPQIAVRGPHLV